MKNFICYIGVLISIVIINAVFVFCFKESTVAAEFLASYGWETESTPIESVEISIPDEFDDVYNNYNILQKEAGLDLEKYKGCKAVRYTFIILNYPEIKENVHGNVIMVEGKPVAGDISTVALDGFMHSLNANSETCFGYINKWLTKN